MSMEIAGSYSRYAVQSRKTASFVNIIDKKEAAKTAETQKTDKAQSAKDYFNELKKLAPSVEFKIGNTFSKAKTGKTLTISPMLLEKMQNDPEQEKEAKELIKGVEMMTMFSESVNKASGWKTVFRHSYIDENGKYYHVALVRNEHGYKISEKLREEKKKNTEKLIEKSKEKAEKAESGKIGRFLDKKLTDSKDNRIYINDNDFRMILKAVKAENESLLNKNGAGLDLHA